MFGAPQAQAGIPAPAAAFGGFGAKTGFGQQPAAQPVSSFGGFGAAAPAVPASGGLFGAKPPGAMPTAMGGSLFGGSVAPTAMPGGSLFGGAPAAAKPGFFGGASTGFNGASSVMSNNGASTLQASIDKNPYGNNVRKMI
jgi:hypothetical protein